MKKEVDPAASKRGRSNRVKGKVFERLVVKRLRDVFGENVKRGLGQARSAGEVADVEGTPYWVEAKHHRKVSISAAMKQAQETTDGRKPLVISRDTRGEILATMTLEHFCELQEQLRQLRTTVATPKVDQTIPISADEILEHSCAENPGDCARLHPG